jgi:rhodanese-related sulfurtransferase
MENPQPTKGAAPLPIEINVLEAKHLVEASPNTVLLDIREPIEVSACTIAGARHIPMGEVPLSWNSLPKDTRLLVYCHHGRRSLMVTQFLRQHGLDLAQSISGGIDAWSREIDSSVPRY